MSTASATIYGQAIIIDSSLIQDQTLIIEGKGTVNNTIVLIDDIWTNLLNSAGNDPNYGYKVGKNGYFYWEVDQSDTANEISSGDYAKVKVKIECPKPKDGLFDQYLNGKDIKEIEEIPEELSKSQWASYWFEKMKIAAINYEHEYSIQSKDYITPEYTMTGVDGDHKLESHTIQKDTNDELINNLLNIF